MCMNNYRKFKNYYILRKNKTKTMFLKKRPKLS